MREGFFGRYVPSGHLVYIHSGTLFAAPFDPGRLEVIGQAVPVLERVSEDTTLGTAQIAISETGTLVFLPGQGGGSAMTLLWMGREGKTTPIRAAPLSWSNVQFAPDVQRLTQSPEAQSPGSWHPSGRFLAFVETHAQTSNDVMLLPMDGDERSGWKAGKPTVFLNSPFNETWATFSPDGRWMAYVSTESGREEVYVRPFPGPGGKWQVSTDASPQLQPTWSRARNELFYTATAGRLMVVPYTVEGDSFKADKPRLWADRRVMVRPRAALGHSFDLHPDGERFALATIPQPELEGQANKVVFIFNFFDELRRAAPAGKP